MFGLHLVKDMTILQVVFSVGQKRHISKHITYSLKIPGGKNGHPLGSCVTVADTQHQLSA